MSIRKKKPIVSIQSLIDLFEVLSDASPSDKRINLYRGHPDKDYDLRPSIFRRKEYRQAEKHIFRELVTIQPREFREDKTVFEQLVRMQHYGLPTRLLDLTYNPLVGLYFACSKNDNKDGEFIRFSISKTNVKYFDSDAVSCVANLSNLKIRQRNEIRALTTSVELKNSQAGMQLLHFIMAEKPHFLPKIELSDLKSIFAVRPKQTNQRILAQQGAFFIFGMKSLLEDSNSFGIKIKRTRVAASEKKKLLRELDEININASTLFPEIESATKYIMSKIPSGNDDDETPD